MKKVLLLLLLHGGAIVTCWSQGTVNFANSVTFTTTADRLVRDGCGSPLAGSAVTEPPTHVAQLYYGANAGSLQAHTATPARFRPGPTGLWLGGTRTLTGFAPGTTLTLEVRVWDMRTGATWEVASWRLQSGTFTYTIPLDPLAPPAAYFMEGLRGFTVLSGCIERFVFVRQTNGAIHVVFSIPQQKLDYSEDLRTWFPLGQQSSPFIDTNAMSRPMRFYRGYDDGAFSPNIAGFHRVSVPAGFSMIADQVGRFSPVRTLLPTVLDNTQVYKFNRVAGGYDFLTYIDGVGWHDGDAGSMDMTLGPGLGAFIYSDAAATLTFFGDVQRFTFFQIPTGFSVISSPVPQAGPLDLPPPAGLGFPVQDGDEIYQYNPQTRTYRYATYVQGLGWQGETTTSPYIEVGESFWVHRRGAPGSWTRSLP